MIDYEKLLSEYHLWPLQTWNSFSFTHQQPDSKETVERQVELLRKNLPDGSGLYIYFNAAGECLYVGKAAPLFNRIKSHYYESFKKVPGDTKDNKWHRFFSSNVGSLTVYWKLVEGEADRKMFELALTEITSPAFLRFR